MCRYIPGWQRDNSRRMFGLAGDLGGGRFDGGLWRLVAVGLGGGSGILPLAYARVCMREHIRKKRSGRCDAFKT